MKEIFLTKTVQFISNHSNYTANEIEQIQFGLEGLYLTFTKAVIIFLVAYLLGILKETILILVFFNILRFTGFGFHANNSSQCLLFSTFLFCILPFIFLNIKIPFWILWVIFGFSVLSLLLYAPADTVKRPLPNKKKRKIRKIVTIITTAVYFGLILFVKNYDLSIILFLSILIEAIMVHPITYKLFRQPYRNYRNYVAV